MIPLVKTKKQIIYEKLNKINKSISQIYQLLLEDDRIELYSKISTELFNKDNRKIYNKKKLQTLTMGNDDILNAYLDGILFKMALDTSLSIMKNKMKIKGD